jgi:hypothetical protein
MVMNCNCNSCRTTIIFRFELGAVLLTAYSHTFSSLIEQFDSYHTVHNSGEVQPPNRIAGEVGIMAVTLLQLRYPVQPYLLE